MSEFALKINLSTSQATPVEESTLEEAGLLERRDLQRWVIEHPELIEPGLLVITSEFDQWQLREQRVEDRLDVLLLDSEGSLLVAELKRGRTADTTDLQALKYAAYCATLKLDEVVEEYARFHQVDEDEALQRITTHASSVADEGLGETRIRLIAGSYGPAVTSVVLWLREHDIDIGCLLLTVRKADEDNVLVTARQVIPLPQTEDYLVRKRRREQEHEAIQRRERGGNTVRVLAEAGVLETGMTLRLGVDTLAARLRPAVQALLTREPSAGLADWTGEATARSFRWHMSGEVYSLTGLTKAVLDEAGVDAPSALPGPDFWLLPDGRALYKASLSLREQAD